jgi:UPF0042 nucleotide-binding protein
MQIVIVTGLSGAGKSTALRALEDIEFYVVDNLPMPFAGALVEHLAHEDVAKVAFAVDARQQRHLASWNDVITRLRNTGHRIEVMFLDSRDDVLLRRYSETRRRHPLSGDDLAEGLRRDREVMRDLRQGANVIDTSNLNPHQLKAIIQDHYGGDGRLAVTLLSFGFKHGLPAEFNLVFDIRFLPNPHFEPALKPLDGRDTEVASYVYQWPESRELTDHIERLLRFSLPQFQNEGKLYVTVAVGCTGGRHRSVAMVEELRRRLGDDWDILVRHRDVDRGE